MKAGKKKYIAIAVAMGLMVTALPQTVLSEVTSKKQVTTAVSKADDAEQLKAQKEEEDQAAEAQKAEEARKAAEAQKAEEARKAAEAQKAEEARKAAEAQKAEEARKAAEAQDHPAAPSGMPDETLAGAPAAQSQPSAEASAAQSQQASEGPADQSQPAAEAPGAQSQPSSEDVGTQDQSSKEDAADTEGVDHADAGSDDNADNAETPDTQDEEEPQSEDPESNEPVEETVFTPAEGVESTESEEEDLEAAGEYSYQYDSCSIAPLSLGGTYVLGDSVSSFPVPSVTYKITVTGELPEGYDDPATIEKTVTGGGTWQYGPGINGPWTDMTTVPSDKSQIYVSYHMPKGKISFTGIEGETQEIDVEAADSEAVLLNRKYPQFFSTTIAQNADNADYSLSLSGYPGISITLSLVNASGAQIGTATKTMSDMPSAINLINHFLSSDWSVNLFGLSENDVNQNVRLKVTQNAVDGDAISPFDPVFSNEIYLVLPISGSVTIPSAIHIGDDVTADISGLKNPSKLTLKYQWYLGSGSAAAPISGASSSTYTVTIEDLVAAGSKVLSCSVADVLGKIYYSQEVTVLPLDLSAPGVDVDWEEEASYTGKKSFPKDISVTTTSYEVPESMWKVTRVKGKNCVNPGEAWMKIKGISEYVIGSRKVKYTIKGGQSEEKKETKAAPADLTVTDSLGAAKKYEIRIVEETQNETVKIYEVRTFDDNTVVDETVYSQRNLHITRDMINKAKDAGCSFIRFHVEDGGIDLAVSELPGDSYMVYFAPDDGRGASFDEKAVLESYQPKGDIYRVSVRTVNEYGEDIDVIDTMLKARVLLYGNRDEHTQFLLLSHDTLEPAVNNAEKKSANGESYLSGRIYRRSLYTATLVD